MAEAEKRTEARLEELAEAEKRTEARLEELAEAQRRTEARMEELAAAQKELASAQKRTEARMEELAEAQKELTKAQGRIEARVEMLAEAEAKTRYEVRVLASRLKETNSTLGGLGRSMAYALENEAYRMVPPLLADKHKIIISERLVRTFIGGKEINLFGRGRRDGREVLIVGETKLSLDERRKGKTGEPDVFEQLAAKVEAVRAENPGVEIVPLLITHHARPSILKAAQEKGIIVVQSFEW